MVKNNVYIGQILNLLKVLISDELRSSQPQPKVPSFKKINDNEYLCSKELCRVGKDSSKMECDCRPGNADSTDPCGETTQCLNRLMSIECSSECRFGDKCRNQRFQKKIYAKLEIFWTVTKGHGLKAKAEIGNGDFIIEYIGEVVSTRDFTKRSHEYRKRIS